MAVPSEIITTTSVCTGENDALSLALGVFSDEFHNQFMSWVQLINADSRFKWNIYPRHATCGAVADSLSRLVWRMALEIRRAYKPPMRTSAMDTSFGNPARLESPVWGP